MFSFSEHKLQELIPFFEQAAKGDLSLLDESRAFIINNIRLQPEAVEKERAFMYVGKGGKLYEEKVGKAQKWDDEYKRYCSRIRLVFNYPLLNLFTQIYDTCVHNTLLTRGRATFHHDMTSRVGKHLEGFSLFVDCKHFERSVGATVRERCKQVGGLYSAIMDKMLNLPYLVPSDDGDVYLMRVNTQGGYVEQMGSGVSCVAPIAKEILTIIYASFFAHRQQMSKEDAINLVMGGGTPDLQILNYGDDNVLHGSQTVVMQCFEYLARYLSVEPEDPPKFLGYRYSKELGFHLSVNSYLTNLYLNERPPYSKFRPYPFYGFMERRKVYSDQGHPDIRGKIIPFEDETLRTYGYTQARLAAMADVEEKEVRSLAPLGLNMKSILEKTYQLSEEEKMRDPRFNVLGEEAVKRYLKILLT